MVIHLPYPHIVSVQKFVEFSRNLVQESFDRPPQIAQIFGAFFRQTDISPKRLDVDVHFGRRVAQLADGFFELGGLAVGVFQAEVRSTSRCSSTKNCPLFCCAERS